MSLGKYISGPAAALLLLFFVLPWVSVSCAGQPMVEATGYQLARGTDTGIPSDPKLYLIPLVAIITLALIAAGARLSLSERVSGGIQLVSAVVGLVILWLKWSEMTEGMEVSLIDALKSFGQPIASNVLGVEFNMEFGLLGSLVGLLLMVIGAVVLMVQARSMVDQHPEQPTLSPSLRTMGMTSSPPMIESPLPPGSNVFNESGYVDSPTAIPESFHPIMPRDVARISPKTEVLQSTPKTLAWLIVREGSRAGHQFHLFDMTNIGRDADNEVILDDTALSGRHARIKVEGGKFVLYDLASTNGTLVYDTSTSDWQKIHRQELKDGDQIKFGRNVLHFMTIGDRDQEN